MRAKYCRNAEARSRGLDNFTSGDGGDVGHGGNVGNVGNGTDGDYGGGGGRGYAAGGSEVGSDWYSPRAEVSADQAGQRRASFSRRRDFLMVRYV